MYVKTGPSLQNFNEGLTRTETLYKEPDTLRGRKFFLFFFFFFLPLNVAPFKGGLPRGRVSEGHIKLDP